MSPTVNPLSLALLVLSLLPSLKKLTLKKFALDTDMSSR